MTFSICMIVRDEELVLRRCLNSVKEIADEIIIVDTGSVDSTKHIALEYTNKVYDFQWIDDFAAARNYSFQFATMDYILWIDADDTIDSSNIEKLKTLKKNLTLDTEVVMLKYVTEQDENHNPLFFYYRERIIKNNHKHYWKGAVHEAIMPKGKIIYEDISIFHHKLKPCDSHRNLNIYQKLIQQDAKLTTRDLYYYGRELFYHSQYSNAISIFKKFLKKQNGWIENKIEACLIMSKCYEKLNQNTKILPILYRSFQYDTPRAEICCEIGSYWRRQNDFEKAVFWYSLATTQKIENRKDGFIWKDCYDYIPYLELTVCYYYLNQMELAKTYNEKAGQLKPNSTSYLYNLEFFKSLNN